MVVVYYTTPYFLDAALETIQSIKYQVLLHVIIEISPESKQSNVINLESLEKYNYLEDAEYVLGEETWKKFKPYFEGVCSVKFLIHKSKRGFGLTSIRNALKLGWHINKLKANIIHFDSITARSIGLYPFIRFKKLFITIHDPVPHSGENNWKLKIPRKVFFNWAKGYFFYSDFSLQLFKINYQKIKAPLMQLKLLPYSISAQKKDNKFYRNSILFFGRLSEYKGIDLFIEAAKIVLKKYSEEKFIIAGAPSFNYEIDKSQLLGYEMNFEIHEGYLSTEELSEEIIKSKFVVCPYRDATQSGVLMTAFANHRMVVATNVGAFKEYITPYKNGLLCEPNSKDLAEKMEEALIDNQYQNIEINIENEDSAIEIEKNQHTLLYAYERVLKMRNKRTSSLKLFLTRKYKYREVLKIKS
jgi:glycosyltransferase involved in cell wall biosynthesis